MMMMMIETAMMIMIICRRVFGMLQGVLKVAQKAKDNVCVG